MEPIKDFDKIHYLTLPNEEIYAYRKISHGAPKHTIVFLHGQATSSTLYEDLFDVLEKFSEYDLYALDMRGFGDSSLIKPLNGFKDLVDDVYSFIETLKLKNVSLAGLSTGGAVSQLFAASYPNVLETLILLCSVGAKGVTFKIEGTDSEGKKTSKVVTKFEEVNSGCFGMMNDNLVKKNTEFMKHFYTSTCFNTGEVPPKEKFDKLLDGTFKQRHFLEILWFLHNFNISEEDREFCKGTKECKNIKVPTLIIHGEKDLTIPVEDAKFTYNQLGDKIAKLEILPDVGHNIDVPKFSELIRNFINGN